MSDLPIREVTIEELRELRQKGIELQREIWEEFRPVLEVTAEDLNLILL